MTLLTTILNLISLSIAPALTSSIRSTSCETTKETAYWYNITSDLTSIYKDPTKTNIVQEFCPPARKCYGGQTARIYRLDFDAENVQCVIFNQPDCVGGRKREVLKPSGELGGTEFLWTEWRSFFCWDVRLGILKET